MAASERDRLRADFVRRAGWGDAGERLLAGDASFRKYFRLSRPRGSAVVMDAPPPQEDVRPFVRIGRHLIGLGLSAPEIHAEDEANGFLLLEDLGDDTFARVLAAGGDEGELYGHATDVLVVLHHAGKRALLPGLGAYDGEALIDAAMLLPDWYLPAATGRPTRGRGDVGLSRRLACLPRRPAGRARHLAAARLPQGQSHVVARATGCAGLRPARFPGRAARPPFLRPGLADRGRAPGRFACRARAPAWRATSPKRGLDGEDFATGFALMAAQRHAQIIGLFIRLLKRDGKPDYLPHLPRVWRMFERALQHEALEPLRAWVDRLLPPPNCGGIGAGMIDAAR